MTVTEEVFYEQWRSLVPGRPQVPFLFCDAYASSPLSEEEA
jgi:hypothetical protein